MLVYACVYICSLDFRLFCVYRAMCASASASGLTGKAQPNNWPAESATAMDTRSPCSRYRCRRRRQRHHSFIKAQRKCKKESVVRTQMWAYAWLTICRSRERESAYLLNSLTAFYMHISIFIRACACVCAMSVRQLFVIVALLHNLYIKQPGKQAQKKSITITKNRWRNTL